MLLIKQDKKSQRPKRIWMKRWLKNRNDKSACVNWHILALSLIECYIKLLIIHWFWYIDIFILITLNLYSTYFILIIHYSTRFSFLQVTHLYYAIKTIELMTREAVSFEKIFYWKKFLAFESQKFLAVKCFMKA